MRRGSNANQWLDAALELDAWMRHRDYAGYDPHDWLSAPRVRALTFGNRLLGAAWTQVGKRAPVQLRPIVGVRPARNAKAIGLALSAHARFFELTGDTAWSATACNFVKWLDADAVAHGGGRGWGYPFPWSNRDFHAPPRTPASVVTAFVAHGLLDAAERAPDQSWSERAGQLALDAARFIAGGLNRVPAADGTFCFSYTPLDTRSVYNASLLAASVLARVAGSGSAAWSRSGSASAGERDAWVEAAVAATRNVLAAQRADGSWAYGSGARDQWVDSFHTSYVLVSLDSIAGCIGRGVLPEIDGAIARGLEYWRSAFLQGPAVSFYPGTPFPVDLHAVAHGIITFVELEHRMSGALREAERLAEWCVREARDDSGYFYYQKHRFYTNRLAYMRWTQAWMLLALTTLGARVAQGVQADPGMLAS